MNQRKSGRLKGSKSRIKGEEGFRKKKGRNEEEGDKEDVFFIFFFLNVGFVYFKKNRKKGGWKSWRDVKKNEEKGDGR